MPRLPFISAEPSQITLADRARDVGRWEVAARHYRKALGRNPGQASIWVQYGHALKEQGLLQGAEEAYRRAVALDETTADTHLQLGHALKLQGRLYDAGEAYITAYQLDPEAPFAAAELQTFWPEIAEKASQVAESTVDPKFVEAVYGGTAAASGDWLVSVPRQDGKRLRYRNCEHLLSVHWLARDVFKIFDYLYYFHVNPSVAHDLKTPNQYRCLIYFCETGIGQRLSCNDKFVFDPDFYIETYLDETLVTPRAAYRHWLNSGYHAGSHPNRQNWVKSVLNIDTAILEKLDLPLYLQLSDSDQARVKWTDAFMRFIDSDPFGAQSYLPISADTADFFVAIGDRCAVRGREQQALIVYERILYSVPDHKGAARHRADSLFRSGSVLDAKRLQNELISRGDSDVFSFLTLAECYERLGDDLNAVMTLQRGVRCHPGEMMLRSRFENAAESLISREWHNRAVPMAMLGRFDEARDRLAHAADAISSLVREIKPLPNRPIRWIAIIAVEISRQCVLYRIEQKVEQLQAAGYIVTVYKEVETYKYLADMYKFDAAIFYRVPGWAHNLFAMQKSREWGITTFYEIDDLIFVNEFPDSLESYGGLVTSEEYVGLKLGVPLFRTAIASCDYGIASTTPLADELSKLVFKGKAFVHRNVFGRAHHAIAPKEPKSPHDDPVVIFYGSGTKAHKGDFQQLVEPALVEIVRRHGDRIVIVLAGYNVLSPQLEAIRDNLRIIEINWDVEQYWANLAAADISIAVLRPSTMTDCKSEIKWMEAAMFGIPSVVSGTATYREVIEPGVTGLICDTSEEWTSALDLLVRDSALRHRMGRNAWQRVRETYSSEQATQNLVRIFNECSPVREARPRPTVLIVNVFYPPQTIGGATRVVHDNVRHLSTAHQDDFRVEVFTTLIGGVRDNEISCYVQDGVRVTAVARRSDSDVENAVADDGIREIFGEFLDELQPSLIHFHCIQRLTTSALSAAKERGIPYLITAHDAWWISSQQFGIDEYGTLRLYDYAKPLATVTNLGKPEYDRMMQLMRPLFGAAQVLAVSDEFASLYRGCGVPNVLTIANGLSDLPEPKRTRSADGRVRLAFLGSMARIKGYDLVRYALLSKTFQNLHLIVMDPGLQPGQSRHTTWNTTPVEFFAMEPADHVVDLYGRTDVLLAPSIWPESFGLVTREALHFGCWVVASDRGSIGACVIEGVNGHIVDVSDASDLIRVLTLIDDSPERYLDSPPRPDASRRSSQQGDELAALYRSICHRTRGRTRTPESNDPHNLVNCGIRSDRYSPIFLGGFR